MSKRFYFLGRSGAWYVYLNDILLLNNDEKTVENYVAGYHGIYSLFARVNLYTAGLINNRDNRFDLIYRVVSESNLYLWTFIRTMKLFKNKNINDFNQFMEFCDIFTSRLFINF